MAAVKIQGLIKNYGGITAVDGLDLNIADGEFVVLLGPSGCGKTTSLRCIAGLEDVSKGSIHINNKLVSGEGFSVPPEQRDIGMVFQSYAIWPHMTVAENVAFGLNLKNISRDEISQKVTQTLEIVGLEKFGNRSSSQLSGGQQQRVALARAIILEPSVLLFDEPLSNLDAKLRERMRFELRQLQRRLGITSIYVTHDQQEAMIIADRVILMNQGKIDQIGSPNEIYQKPISRFGAEFIGLANIHKAIVLEVRSESTRFKLEGNIEMESTSLGFKVGEEVDVVVRPEDVELSLENLHIKNSFEAKVMTCYFLGNIADAVIQSGSLAYRCQIGPRMNLTEGSSVWSYVDPSSIILLKR